ncbi:LuxR C-terminal-related transcriptional regulator [Nocardioides mesophilus]|uniref:Helix-turn-helix transcriptional regulator n=1 Tax=Nocardioides mesophilus TaxID=433659 RepID=A0A7G9RBJ0_9ACTN|nr:LuxR C-terminal-related transcriptional regulator [Nocardioides mesophilus]QNN52965.1 helix-turn-helix transcriptional regulator [Nocardioides mesophilus]
MPVLATKVHLPEPRADSVARPRLQERLRIAQSDTTRLVLVSAPAGFGKTTVLSQWFASPAAAGLSVAWVSLDVGDNDVRRFLTHLIAACQSTNPALGVDVGDVVETAAEVPVEMVLTSLVNDLDMFADATVLALDDYHEITAPAVHEVLAFLLDHLPGQVRIAMATRSDPPLAVARLRSTGGLLELRAADLRFTAEEAADLLNDAMGLTLARKDVDTLDERTEGWAAGLQMAALSLSGHEDPTAFVDDFAGSHRFVLDYLVEEVLDRQPDRVREFLLATSVLRELSGSLCDAVTGTSDAQEILESLERRNVFVIPLDDGRRWYRYHHLFGDALRARLLARHPDRLRGLHIAAGRWLVEHGMLPDAVAHAIAGEDHELTADLVELALAGLRQGRQDATIVEWLAAVPAEVVRRRPLLATATGWSRLAAGDFEGVEAWLDVAQGALDARPVRTDLSTPAPQDVVEAHAREMRALPAMIAVYRAAVAQARGDVAGTIAHAQRAYDLAGPEDDFSRGAGAGFLGLAAWAAGDLQAAVETFSDAVVSMRAAGLVADALGSAVVLGSMWLTRGRPLEARRIFEEALATAVRPEGPILPTVGDVRVGLADVLRELGDLDAAARHLEVAGELGDLASLPENRHRWYTTKAAVLRASGDLDGAIAMLDEAEPMFRPGFFPEVRPIAAARARVRLAQGNVIEARAWARQHEVRPDDEPTFLQEYDQLTLARVLIAEGSPADAIALVEQILDLAQASGRDGSLVEAHVVGALAHHASGDPRAAAEDLSAALIVGVPAGYRRLFLDEGPVMVDLLTSLPRGAPTDVRRYAEQVLASAKTSRTTPRRDQHPDEALSERELDVLRLLATDLTGPEIARRLYVSLNTLRTHTKHIFTKLGVNTRRAAVSRAAERGLL